MHIMDEEKAAAIEKSKGMHHKIPTTSSLPVDFNGNVMPAAHPSTQKSHKRIPHNSQCAPHTAQGNFTPTPRSMAYHQTAEHDSDIPKSSSDSLESGNSEDDAPQRSRHFIQPDQRPGPRDERDPSSLDTDNSSASGNHKDKVCKLSS